MNTLELIYEEHDLTIKSVALKALGFERGIRFWYIRQNLPWFRRIFRTKSWRIAGKF
ncbi:MAG: hypothetical protein ACE5GO_08355 [Anaerolineales bacterium]